MPFRDFDEARKEAARVSDPPSFQLGGETFTCLAKVPLGFSFELMDAPEVSPETNAGAIHAMTKFLRRILVDEDNVARFDALLARREDPITGGDILDVSVWLGELYSGRPFGNAESSSNSPPTNGTASSAPNSGPAGDLSWSSR